MAFYQRWGLYVKIGIYFYLQSDYLQRNYLQNNSQPLCASFFMRAPNYLGQNVDGLFGMCQIRKISSALMKPKVSPTSKARQNKFTEQEFCEKLNL